MNGYAGKILRVNLSDGKVSHIETRAYEAWVGGHGMGSALFWDLVRDKKIDGFHEDNVVTILTSPLTGTLAPGGASRVEMQGVGVQSYPVGWFTRSNLGGRFGPMLKYAGWDGIVIEGKSEKPVWLDIRDGKVQIRDARNLWGFDTWDTQRAIWEEVTGRVTPGDWIELGDGAHGGRTTQMPAVLAIGPTGERLSRVAAIIHDAGNAAGQGGFGAVWGSKNLKAVSVIGTGSVRVSDPAGLLDARLWAKKHYGLDLGRVDKLDDGRSTMKDITLRSLSTFGTAPVPLVFWQRRPKSRPQACVGCPAGCRARNDTGLGNESGCAETYFYSYPDLKRHGGLKVRLVAPIVEYLAGDMAALLYSLKEGDQSEASYRATDLAQKYGINAFELFNGISYLRNLYKMGALGPGRSIPCDLPFDSFGEVAFIEELLRRIAFREEVGDDIAEGFFRAAERWGRLREDTASGLLRYPHWGLPDHYDPRFQVEWGYGSILGDRDINEHGFNVLYWMPTVAILTRKDPLVTAEEAARIFADRMEPFAGDLEMVNYGTENIYSDHMAKTVAWHRHYTRFWKQSVLYCDFLFPDFLNPSREDRRGMVGIGEPRFFKAVTGRDIDFAEGIEIGRRIWNLDHAIWTLQGRHRDMVRFADYIYTKPYEPRCYMPGVRNGRWEYLEIEDRCLDRGAFEKWKTRFYELEGWDPETGWPRRATLEALGLGHVASELDDKGRLGKG